MNGGYDLDLKENESKGNHDDAFIAILLVSLNQPPLLFNLRELRISVLGYIVVPLVNSKSNGNDHTVRFNLPGTLPRRKLLRNAFMDKNILSSLITKLGRLPPSDIGRTRSDRTKLFVHLAFPHHSD